MTKSMLSKEAIEALMQAPEPNFRRGFIVVIDEISSRMVDIINQVNRIFNMYEKRISDLEKEH